MRGPGKTQTTINIKRRDGTLILKPAVSLMDADRLQELFDVFSRTNLHGARRVMVDFSDVRRIHDAAVAVLVQMDSMLSGKGARLVLIAPPDRLRALLDIFGFAGYFEVWCSEDNDQGTAARGRPVALPGG